MGINAANVNNTAERIVITNPSRQRFLGAAEHARLAPLYEALNYRQVRCWRAGARFVLRENRADRRKGQRRGSVVACSVVECNPEPRVELIRTSGIAVQEHVGSANPS
ncbi:hypothetical protein WMF38_17815 [Sorangium sp. So ce118]